MQYYRINTIQWLDSMITHAICQSSSHLAMTIMNKYGKDLLRYGHGPFGNTIVNEKYLMLPPSNFNSIFYRPNDMFDQINKTVKKIFDPMSLRNAIRLLDKTYGDLQPIDWNKQKIKVLVFAGELYDWGNPSNNRFYAFDCTPSNLSRTAELNVLYLETPFINVFRLKSSWRSFKMDDSLRDTKMVKIIKKAKYPIV